MEVGADPSLKEAVCLAASEAMTNAVVHAYHGQPGRVYVTAAVVSDELWILIADDGRGLEPRSERPGLGLGLGLIAQVTSELAIVPRANGGTEVRMRFDLPRSSAPDSNPGSTSGRAGTRQNPGRRAGSCRSQQYA